MVRWALTLILIVVLIPACAASIDITSAHGETWISWDWDTQPNPLTIYVDGSLKHENTSMNYFYLTDISANEEHRIDIYEWADNTTTFLGSDVERTAKQSWFAYLVLVIAAALALITIALKNPAEILMTGLLCMIFSFYLAANTWSQLGAMSFVGSGLIIFSGIWITKALWDMVSKKTAWW
jgi:hypothetical protein